jgi:hypothetical protein
MTCLLFVRLNGRRLRLYGGQARHGEPVTGGQAAHTGSAYAGIYSGSPNPRRFRWHATPGLSHGQSALDSLARFDRQQRPDHDKGRAVIFAVHSLSLEPAAARESVR